MTVNAVTLIMLQEFTQEEGQRLVAEANGERRAGRMGQEDAIRISLTWRAIHYWMTGDSAYADGWCWTGMNGNIEYLVTVIKEELARAETKWASRKMPEPPTHDLHYDDVWQDWYRVQGYRKLAARVDELSLSGRKYEEVARYRAWRETYCGVRNLERRRA